MAIVWWHWLVLGLLLIALELAASGGFYIIFFGIAAVVISLMAALGAETPVWAELALFSVMSVGSLLLFRGPLMRWLNVDGAGADVDSLVGETGVVQQDIAPHDIGRVELRGSSWRARNNTATLLPAGRRVTVVRVDRLMLIVEAEGAPS
ncbi:MAG TPA: NfeD family protein [Vicinamibacterales bacterium]|nr:NfeD family protein [Vicinamibacterales bacterium]